MLLMFYCKFTFTVALCCNSVLFLFFSLYAASLDQAFPVIEIF